MNQLPTENFPKIVIDFKSSEFDKLFLETIDQAFTKLLGITAKEAFFSYLDKKYNLSKEEIPDKIGDFVEGLEKIFGTSALILEIQIMKALRQRVPSFNCFADGSDLSFELYIESLKQQMANQ